MSERGLPINSSEQTDDSSLLETSFFNSVSNAKQDSRYLHNTYYVRRYIRALSIFQHISTKFYRNPVEADGNDFISADVHRNSSDILCMYLCMYFTNYQLPIGTSLYTHW